MEVVIKMPDFTVIDDFLAPSVFTSLAASLQFIEYRTMHDRSWIKAFGNPAATVLQSSLVTRGRVNSTPPGLGQVGSLVERAADARADFLGAHSRRSGEITTTGRVVLSGPGAGLRWHNDASHLLGAYVFYAHPRWGSHWGGELLVMPEAGSAGGGNGDEGMKQAIEQADIGPDFGLDDRAEQRRMSIGHGIYVAAKPNRLVLLSPQVHHRVTPVDAAAGEMMRAGIAGFIVPDAALSSASPT